MNLMAFKLVGQTRSSTTNLLGTRMNYTRFGSVLFSCGISRAKNGEYERETCYPTKLRNCFHHSPFYNELVKAVLKK